MPKIAKVALRISLDKEFDYSCPENSALREGMRVLVDFNRKKRVGIVVGIVSESYLYPNTLTGTSGYKKKLKPIIDILDSQALLNDGHLCFAQRLSNLYPYGRSEFLFMMMPSYLRKINKIDLRINDDKSKKEKTPEVSFIKADIFLERYRLWKNAVRNKLKEGSVFICFPQLTYLESARKVIEKDFSGQAKVIHSREKEKELFSIWKETRKNSLILGTRAAIFYYPADLKLIVIEEESSLYYFQEEKPYYSLPEVANLLSQIKGVDLILSGDYPSLTAYKRIKEKEIKLLDKKGVSRDIEVINTLRFSKNKLIGPILTELLRKAIQDNKKALILWNRKGFARVISCVNCGHIFKCEHCSGFLQSSLKSEEGVCPHCQRKVVLPRICNYCNSGYLKSKGYGIQRLGSILKKIFPEVKINNSQDPSSNAQITLATSKILSCLYEHQKFDKGFVLDADLSLARIDYDATFKTFLYLKKLLLLLNDSLYVFTRHKDYYLFKHLNERWEDFYEAELQFRKKSQFPPFGLIVKIILRAKNEKTLFKKIKDLYNRLERKFKEIYGPFEEKPFKLRDKFRYSIILKIKKDSLSRELLKEEIKDFRSSSMQVAVSLR